MIVVMVVIVAVMVVRMIVVVTGHWNLRGQMFHALCNGPRKRMIQYPLPRYP